METQVIVFKFILNETDWNYNYINIFNNYSILIIRNYKIEICIIFVLKQGNFKKIIV